MGWLASLFTFVGLLLNARKVRMSWWVWIVGDVLWVIHGVSIHDKSIVFLNVVFVYLNYYGWWKWRPAEVQPTQDVAAANSNRGGRD